MRAAGRIAIFRALQLGDMLCSVPALRALRAANPDAHIVLIGLPWAETFLERYPGLLDELIVFPGAPGFPEQDETGDKLPEFFRCMQAQRFDLALQLHGSGGPANDLVRQFGAAHVAGFVQPGEERREGCFIPWPDNAPEPERYLLMMQALGVPVRDTGLSMPLIDADRAEAQKLIAECGEGAGPFVIVHAGAQLPSRRWPTERFAAVADALVETGATVVLTGTASEAPLAESVRSKMNGPACNLAGRTSLGGLAALVERADLVVCNDTGISHIAAAIRTPSVVVAMGSDTRRWAPADKSLHRVLARHPECRPCTFSVCPVGHGCALGITVEEVIAASMQQLAGASIAA